MDYLNVTRDENFQRIAAFIRTAKSTEWAQSHPESKFGFYYGNFVRLARQYHPDLRGDLIEAYTGMTSSANEVDVMLSHYVTTDAVAWFIGLLDGNRQAVKTTLALLLAVASCEDTTLTPVECAAQTGTSESGWRNKAAAGLVPGARKVGKQWLIPSAWLKYGDV
jgi:hypothetical protein